MLERKTQLHKHKDLTQTQDSKMEIMSKPFKSFRAPSPSCLDLVLCLIWQVCVCVSSSSAVLIPVVRGLRGAAMEAVAPQLLLPARRRPGGRLGVHRQRRRRRRRLHRLRPSRRTPPQVLPDEVLVPDSIRVT